MFEFLKNLFSTKKENNFINLIDILKNDHKNLIEIYQKIDNYIEKNDFTNAKQELKKFINKYNRHILLEDTQLYITLEEQYKDKKQILKVIHSISKDMNSITRAITFFEKKYSEINENNKNEFKEEFREIGTILLDRVELEEERLYPLLNENIK